MPLPNVKYGMLTIITYITTPTVMLNIYIYVRHIRHDTLSQWVNNVIYAFMKRTEFFIV